MSTLIETVGLNGKPLFIARDKIMGMNECSTGTNDSPLTVLYLAAGETCDEWRVRETLESLRVKYDNS